MQKNQNSKGSHGKGKPAPSGAFTHRIREDGEVFSSEEGCETSSDTTPLASVAGSVRMRSTDSDRSKATANLEKILSNMASQAASTSEATQAALAAILARLEVKPVDTRFADAVKRRLTHQQLVERQPDFRKAGAAAWLALKRETSVPAHSATESGALLGSPTHLCSGFPYAKPGDLRKAMQGARIRTSAVRDIRWISRQVVQLLVDADYVSALLA
ncbi:hypothetical protein BASA83_003994 [Batrachochytrium salamandrivorans]|nr:hypothetical protein BASA83_003994 [Batrachochytrium salamandrivorans]